MKTEGPGELWISGPLLLDFLPLPRYAGSIKNTEAILLLSFASDYIAGAHPEILRRLAATNLEPLPGYGSDIYCQRAAEKIRAACGCPEAEVYFLVGGTQTNQLVLDTMLRPWEGVLASRSGHVSTHEAGAIEYTCHKVLTR